MHGRYHAAYPQRDAGTVRFPHPVSYTHLTLPTIQRLTALCSAWHPEQAEAFAALRAEAEQLTAENACCRVSQLAVNGRDLMAAGVRPGPGLRQVLNALLEAVITGQTPNEKDALLAAAAQFSAS